jgi:hypothetical protein
VDPAGQTLVVESPGSSASIARASRQFGRAADRVTVDVLLLSFHLTAPNLMLGLREVREAVQPQALLLQRPH